MSLAGRSAAAAEQFVSELATDYRTADLTPADLVMLDYAIALTQAPPAVAHNAIPRLRAAGFDDRAMHDICAVTAYFAFVNRIAEGLGVELEERLQH